MSVTFQNPELLAEMKTESSYAKIDTYFNITFMLSAENCKFSTKVDLKMEI